MATELGTAYVAVVPSLKGASAAIKQQLDGGSIGAQIGSALGGSVQSSAGDGLKKAGAFASKTFGTVAKAGVGMVTGIGGTLAALAAKGGMTRALNLEQAQQMFKGMKLDWADYKDTVSAAVDGTAFSLDQAALVAANLAASGVGAGEDMQRALDACTGTAATFGRDLGDIGGIFQKVAAQGKITGETVQQFADRGVNVTAILSEALGKTSDEIKDMTSKGKIDFKTFSDAMYDAFGESAAAANETFTGSMGNMMAALFRIGEKFMTPIKDNAVPVFNSVMQALNQVNKALDPLSEKFSAFAEVAGGKVVAAFDGFASRMEEGASLLDAVRGGLEDAFGADIVSRVEGIVAAVGGLAALGPVLKLAGEGVSVASKGFQSFQGVAGPVAAALSNGATQALGFAKNLGGAATSAVGIFGRSVSHGLIPQGAFDALYAIPNNIRYGLAGARGAVGEALGGVREAVAERLGGLGETVNNALGGIPGRIGGALGNIRGVLTESVGNAVTEFKNKFNIGTHAEGEGGRLSAVFGKIKGAAGGLSGTLVKAAGGLTAVAGGLLTAGFAAVASGVDLEAASQQFMEKINAVVTNLPLMAQQFAVMLPGIIGQLVQALPSLVNAFIQAFTSITDSLPTIIQALSEGLTTMIPMLVPVIVQCAPMLLDAGLQLFKAIVQSLSEILPVLVAILPTLVDNVANVLIENLPTLLEAGLTLFMALVTAFIDMLPRLIEKLPDLILRVGSKLASFGPRLLEVAKTLFMKICEAVPKILTSLLSALGNLLSQLPGKITSFAGRMATAAKDMIKGMVQGIGDAAKWVIDKIGSLCSDALGAVKSFFGIASPSKLMRKMFGFVGEGMILGLDDKADGLKRAMMSSVEGATDVCKAFQPELNVGVGYTAGKLPAAFEADFQPKPAGDAPSQTFNIYANDPEQVAAMVAVRQRQNW